MPLNNIKVFSARNRGLGGFAGGLSWGITRRLPGTRKAAISAGQERQFKGLMRKRV